MSTFLPILGVVFLLGVFALLDWLRRMRLRRKLIAGRTELPDGLFLEEAGGFSATLGAFALELSGLLTRKNGPIA